MSICSYGLIPTVPSVAVPPTLSALHRWMRIINADVHDSKSYWLWCFWGGMLSMLRYAQPSTIFRQNSDCFASILWMEEDSSDAAMMACIRSSAAVALYVANEEIVVGGWIRSREGKFSNILSPIFKSHLKQWHHRYRLWIEAHT